MTKSAVFESKLLAWTFSLSLVFILSSCYPERQATMIDNGVAAVQAPTKVFLSDASIVLFPEGFQLKEGSIQGKGVRYSSFGNVPDIPMDRVSTKHLTIPQDSAVAMTYYESVNTGGRVFASVMLGLWGGTITPVSIYCLANPKACFGCCPTVYAKNNDAWEFQAELFSYSISRLLESEDLDKIAEHVSSGSRFTMRVANEALETHNINMMQLVAVDHPAGTAVFPTSDGDFVAVKDLHAPMSAVNSEGRDILSTVQYLDGRAYRSDAALARQAKSGRTSDWIDLRIRPPRGSHTATLVISLKNTLLSTVLFYELVLGSQGVQAIDWTERMNSDRAYASLFRSVYRQFSGVRIMALRNGVWQDVGEIDDSGPVGWKPVAIRIPVEDENDLTLRLEFFPDNILIDYLTFDFTAEDNHIESRVVPPSATSDRAGKPRPDILPLIQGDDKEYLVTEPQDVYRFVYDLPPGKQSAMTLFVRSKGYYTEWIRGGWISQPRGPELFDLFHIDQTITRLVDLWIRERESMESLFFRNRIPITEEGV